jgi:hypothetical protein
MVIKRYLLPTLFALIIAFGGICFNPVPTHAMSQVFIAGYPDPLNNANATEYNSVAGGHLWRSGTSAPSQVVSTAGKIKNLYVELSSAAGAGADDTYTFTLMYDGAASALTCAIVQGATSASDTTHEIDVVAGKLIILKCVSSGSPSNTPNAQWSMIFSGTTANESIIMGNVASSATTYSPISQGSIAASGAEVGSQQIIPTAGTIKSLYVNEVDGIGTGTWTCTVNKNSVAQTLTCAVTVAAPTNNDTAHSFTVAAGDTISMTTTVTGSITGAGVLRYGMVFVADTDGESIILGGSNQNVHTSNTLYNSLPTSNIAEPWNATETTQQHLGQVCTLRNLYIYCATAPGAGKAFVFTVRNNAAGTAITCTATGAATPITANDTTHSVTLAAMDNIALECDPDANSPTVGQVKWGLVCYMYPEATVAPTSYNFGIVATSSTTNTGLDTLTITNTGTVAIDITISGTDLTGGTTWTLSDNATAGADIYGLKAGLEGGDYTIIVKKTAAYNTLKSNLAIAGTQKFGLQLLAPTSLSSPADAVQKSGTVTLIVVAH